VNQEQRVTVSRLDEKSLDVIHLNVFLLAGYCHTVVLLKTNLPLDRALQTLYNCHLASYRIRICCKLKIPKIPIHKST
jgi:hypothetical protein